MLQHVHSHVHVVIAYSMARFYGRAAAELSFSDFVLRTFTRTMKTVISYNSLELYLYHDPEPRTHRERT